MTSSFLIRKNNFNQSNFISSIQGKKSTDLSLQNIKHDKILISTNQRVFEVPTKSEILTKNQKDQSQR
jgi:hypothetical protein